MVFPKNCWQTKAETLNPSWPKNCANWPTSEGCEQHHIIQSQIASVWDLFNPYQYDLHIGNYRPAKLKRLSSHTSACKQLYQNHATDFSPYYFMYGWKPRLPIDIRFGLASHQAGEHSHNKFLAKLSAQLRWCHELADLHLCKGSTNHNALIWPENESLQAWIWGALSGKTVSIWG